MSGVALGRSAFHGLSDLRREKVELPQRGGYVLVREMCATHLLAQSLNRDEFVLIQDKVMAINGLGEDVEKK